MNNSTAIVVIVVAFLLMVLVSGYNSNFTNIKMAEAGLQQCQETNGAVLWKKECK
jgi:hypothetical protein